MLVTKNRINTNIYNRINFTSKVTTVYSAGAIITEGQKDFVDKFEEADEEAKVNSLKCKYLGEGICSKAYYSPLEKFVIKANKKKTFDHTKDVNEPGSLLHENYILSSLNSSIKDSQQGIALFETEKGGEFLLSTLAEGKPANIHDNPYTQKHINRLVKTLYNLDENGITNPDLSMDNILLTKKGAISLIDYQWAEKTKLTQYNDTYRSIRCPEFEAPSNDLMFEKVGFAEYLDELSEKSIPDARNFLKMYLQEKAPYCKKRVGKIKEELEARESDPRNVSVDMVKERIEFEKLKSELFKKPSQSVMDTEILKINISKQHRKAQGYFDQNVTNSRNILMGIPCSLRAYLSANELTQRAKEEQLKTQNPKFKKYFSYMERYGNYWQENFKQWYPPTFKWVFNLATGSEYDPFKRLSSEKLTDFEKIKDLGPMLYNQKTTNLEPSSDFFKFPDSINPLSNSKYSETLNAMHSNGNDLQSVLNNYCLAHIESKLNNPDKVNALQDNLDNFIRQTFYSSDNVKRDVLPKVFNNSKFWEIKSLPHFKGNSNKAKILGQKLDIQEVKKNQRKSNRVKIFSWNIWIWISRCDSLQFFIKIGGFLVFILV